jgi:hypothetical protein
MLAVADGNMHNVQEVFEVTFRSSGRRLPTWRPGSDPRPGQAGLVEKVAVGLVFFGCSGLLINFYSTNSSTHIIIIWGSYNMPTKGGVPCDSENIHRTGVHSLHSIHEWALENPHAA